MNNYKKSLLSLAAILAMTSVVSAQNYIPLTNDNFDYRWSMFGIDGFKLDGATQASTAAFTAGNWTTLQDVGANDSATGGYGGLIELKALNLDVASAASELTSVTINLDATVETFSETEAMRTMFLKIPSLPATTTDTANVMVTYKASLEGKSVEFRVNGLDTYTFATTLSALKTYDVADDLAGAEKTSDTNSSAGDYLTSIEDVMDYDFTENPLDSENYNSNLNRTAAPAGAATRLYTFDAVNGSWQIYDTLNAAAANDFSTYEKGKAYWGRMDIDGSENSTNTLENEAGLVLGSGQITSSDYADNNLSAGWNMMSFDSTNPDIINATSGMIIQTLTAGGDITIVDSTGVNSITVAVVAGLTGPEVLAETINLAVESAKARGDFPDTFDLRAFGANETADQVVLISNKRFSVLDDADTALSTATSLSGANLWDITTAAYAAIADIPALGVTSVYGDYSLAFEPSVGAGSAAELDNTLGTGTLRSAAIMLNEDATNMVYLGADDGASALTAVTANMATQLQAQPDIAGNAASATGNAISIDIDNDGTDDYVIAASDTPFYMRDHTFTRIFAYNNDVVGTFTLAGAKTNSAITTLGLFDQAALVTATNLLTNTGGADVGTGVYAVAGTGTNNIFISAYEDTNFYNLHDDAGDHLTDATTDALVVSKGAVTNVALLNTLAQRVLTPYEITLNVIGADFVALGTADDGVTVDLNSIGATVLAVTGAKDATVAADVTSVFDTIVSEIQTEVKAKTLDAVVTHDFNATGLADASPELAAALLAAKVTIEGYSVSGIDVNFDDVTADNGGDVALAHAVVNATFGNIATITGDVTQDLTFNPVSTPSYAKAGPLYTLKDLGWTAKALITGNTNIDADTVAWDNIDLTRSTTEMFANQDFNLFSIDPKAGYWVYLEDTSTETNPITVTAVGSTLVPTVTHHFDDGEVTARNHISTNLTVLVTGLTVPATGEASTEKVWANVGGTTVELVGDPSDGEYTADIDSYAVALNSSDVTVSVSDGEGWLKSTVSMGSIDVTKPLVPTISLAGGFTIAADANDTDVAAFYLFQNDILETDMHAVDPSATGSGNYIAKLVAGAPALDFCANNDILFDSPITLLGVAVDGGGTFTTGNISDVATDTYYAIQKGSSVYSHDGSATPADDLAIPYNSSCVEGNESIADNGLSVKSLNSGVTASLAVETIDGVTFDLDIPYTIYVTDGTNIAEIKFSAPYGGQPFYVQFNDGVTSVAYSGTLPADDVADFYNTTIPAEMHLIEGGGDLTSSTVANQTF